MGGALDGAAQFDFFELLYLGARLMAFDLKQTGTTAEHAVELVDQERDRLVAFVGFDGGVHVGTVDGDVAFGFEAGANGFFGVALQLNADAHDALLVAKQSFGFLLHEGFERRSQLEMNAGNDQFVVVLSVHVSAYVLVYRSRPDGRLSKLEVTPSHPLPPLNEALKDFTTVIVTGGSSGIGKSFIERCVALAPGLQICNLSRREPVINLRELKVRHFPCDLAQSVALNETVVAVEKFLAETAPQGRVLLLNNSGFGAYGHFPEPGVRHLTEMIDVNVRAVVELTGLLLPLLKRRGGVVVTVASTAAFQPTAYMATYGATKAFVLHWSLALNEELRGTGVRALALCPGPTATEFFRRAGLQQGSVADSLSMTCDEVVDATLVALAGGRALVVPGWKNKLSTFFVSKLPKVLAARLAAVVLARFRLKKVAP